MPQADFPESALRQEFVRIDICMMNQLDGLLHSRVSTLTFGTEQKDVQAELGNFPVPCTAAGSYKSTSTRGCISAPHSIPVPQENEI
jgi:hypothetical protein